MKLRLQSVDAPKKLVLDFAGPTITIGRDNSCDLPLPGTSNVSGRHAQVTLSPEGAMLSDLESTNGTFLNDRRIEGRKKLRKGDYFRLGQTGPCFLVAELDLTSAPVPAPAGTRLEKVTSAPSAPVPQTTYAPLPVNRPMPEPHVEVEKPAPAASGQTRLMVVDLQRKNQFLMVGSILAIAGLLFIVGVVGVYLLWKQRDLDTKTADLDQNAKKSLERIDDINQTVGKVASNVDKLSKHEEDNIFGRYADAVYFVEIQMDKGFSHGTAFALDKAGKLGTNAHITFPADQALKSGRKVNVIAQGGKKVYPVIAAVSHPKYINWPGGKIKHQTPDVGVLTVRLPPGETLPKAVELGTDEDLHKLTPGAQLCYIGFPGWSDYGTLKKIEPHLYKGGLSRLVTLTEESGDFSNQYLLQHDMASTGGASGSPIFNREGRVVAVHNSGQQVTIGPEGKSTAIPYGTKAGMRIDLLKEVMR